MTGPLDGKTYRDVMVPMDNTDEWVAGIASYVRTSFGNTGDLVTPADVARVRAEIAGRKTPWTAARARSHAAAPARCAAVEAVGESRGRDRRPAPPRCAAGAPASRRRRACGSRSSCRRRRCVTEVQFDSAGALGGGRRRRPRRTPAAPAAHRPRRPRRRRCRRAGRAASRCSRSAIRAATRCRCRWTARSGASRWRRARAPEAHTTITFAPARAQFVRITQTDNIADAPPWSIRNLRDLRSPGEYRRQVGIRRHRVLRHEPHDSCSAHDCPRAGTGASTSA